ncbi:MAG: hypothetical protein H0X13_03145 [Ramlibacter sp.]|nr:hypothetical protein [Ramlibacter sp.]
MQETAFRTLLYRYFFFSWLFKDVGAGNLFERAAAARYNREQARWLPTYVLRWLWLGLVFYAAGGVAELVLQAPALVLLLFYTASVVSLSFTVTIGTAWLGIRAQQRSL